MRVAWNVKWSVGKAMSDVLIYVSEFMTHHTQRGRMVMRLTANQFYAGSTPVAVSNSK